MVLMAKNFGKCCKKCNELGTKSQDQKAYSARAKTYSLIA